MMNRRAWWIGLGACLAWMLGVLGLAAGADGEKGGRVNADVKAGGTNQVEVATFGGGCFWCLEAFFEKVPGVKDVVSGYAGGHTENPTYKEVCTKDTGHAEVVQVTFDPSVITYEKVLDVFWLSHDPTTLNRQGADVGSQYRSIILSHTPEQQSAAEKSKAKADAEKFAGRIVTEVVPLRKFYRAEEYHQDFFRKNPGHPYCQAVIVPKYLKLQKGGVIGK